MNLRKILFWFHLVIGVLSGVIIFTLCGTGLVLAFEKDMVARAERNVREVALSSTPVPSLGVDAILEKVREVKPELKPGSVVLFADPGMAVQVSAGRPPSTIYVNPYTGAVSEGGATLLRAVMRWMINCHRYLGAEEPSRAVGKAFTGGATLIMLVLVLTGLFLWWPRQWSWAQVKTVVWFQGKWKGKARDWNWHHVVGLWMAPVLVVLTVSGVVLSYKWASDLVYTMTGTVPPAAPGGSGGARVASGAGGVGAASAVVGEKKSLPSASGEKKVEQEGVKKTTAAASYGPLVEAAQKHWPNWEQITIRMSGAGGGGPEKKAETLVLMIREKDAWPKFASVQATYDLKTGQLVGQEGYSDYNAGRKVRTWLRWLHTGEAFGMGGKIVAALGCAGGMVLVWTGMALTVRRFLGWRKQRGQGAVSGTEGEGEPVRT